MTPNKYRRSQKTLKVGIGPNGTEAEGWWYGEDKCLSVYIQAKDGMRGCHWAKIPRRSIEAWLEATASSKSGASE